MVFVPLIGIDNHWKSVTFAGALLESESSDSFKWLCNSMKTIFIREPRCIITDQCPAMKVAIESVFPLVKHRLCMWHIMKKFPSKVFVYNLIKHGFILDLLELFSYVIF